VLPGAGYPSSPLLPPLSSVARGVADASAPEPAPGSELLDVGEAGLALPPANARVASAVASGLGVAVLGKLRWAVEMGADVGEASAALFVLAGSVESERSPIPPLIPGDPVSSEPLNP